MVEGRQPADMLIVGVAGQVGGALAAALGARAIGTSRQTPFAGGVHLDLDAVVQHPELAAKLTERLRSRVVLLAAGFTNVEACEDEPQRAERINALAPAALARAARRTAGRSVYFSTEYVFDGTNGPYRESDRPCPLSVYGKSKLLGEQLVLEADPDALVIRTTVVYGPERQGKNFACQLWDRLRREQPMRVANDQVSTPTYNRDLAAATIALLDANARGIYHVAGNELLDRAAFAVRLAQALGLDERLIEAVPTSSLQQRAARPLQAGLVTEKLRRHCPEVVQRTVNQAVVDWQAMPLPHRSYLGRAA